VINLIIIVRLLKLPPLRFLRRDLSLSRRKKAMRLPSFKFMNRFRLRIFLQNIGGYLVLLFGIAFVMLMLAFAVGLPETLDHYKGSMTENIITDYQYILKDYKDDDGNIITTSEESAEPFSITELVTVDGVRTDENVSIYGFADGSKYIKISQELTGSEVYISSIFAKKFMIGEGDRIVLKEKYDGTSYEFSIKGIYDYPGAVAVFMPNGNFNEMFGNDEGAFTGFLSNAEIKDIDPQKIYSVVTLEDIMALATQLDHSMGDYMDYIAIACLIIGILVIYLLTKMIIEKNAGSISMVKVLGYENSEINSLYILLTTIVVIVFAVLTALLSILGLVAIFRIFMYSMNGWFDVYISWFGIVKMILILMASYFIVSFFDMRRIRKIPLTDALKNVE
jgi:putative ABC transport system permease protein